MTRVRVLNEDRTKASILTTDALTQVLKINAGNFLRNGVCNLKKKTDIDQSSSLDTRLIPSYGNSSFKGLYLYQNLHSSTTLNNNSGNNLVGFYRRKKSE